MNNELALKDPNQQIIDTIIRDTPSLPLNGMKPLASGISAFHPCGGLRS